MSAKKLREKEVVTLEAFLTLREMLDARRSEIKSVEKSLLEEVEEFNRVKQEFSQLELQASGVLAGLEMRILDKAYAGSGLPQPFKAQGATVEDLLEQFRSLEVALSKSALL